MSVQSPCALVVVNFGSSALLEQNLPHSTQGSPDLHVVVVDNYTDLQERERVAALADRHGWHAVLLDDNRGFGGGVAAGVEQARQLEIHSLLLLNPDARLEPGAAAALRAAVDEDGRSLVSPVIRRGDGRVWFDGADLDLRDGSTRATRKRPPNSDAWHRTWISGACCAVSLQLWDEIGGFDPDYFLYWEDVDLSWRVRAAGGRLRVLPDAVAVHDEGGTQGRQGRRALSDTYYYYNVRNRLLFARKHLDGRGRRRWVRGAPAAAWAIVLRGGRQQLLEGPGPLLAAVRGTIDGLRMPVSAHATDRQPVSSSLSVLQSFRAPRPTTNPYIVMLRDALAADDRIMLSTFSWRRALSEPVDVFHAHWPEILLEATSAPKRWGKRLLFALMLARFHVVGTSIVRTQHNLELPQGLGRVDTALLRRFDAQTSLRVLLNEQTERDGLPSVVIPHGHYRDWYGAYPHHDAVDGRFGYFGLIRRYKAVVDLVSRFRDLPDPGLSLRVGGRPSSDELAAEVRDAAEGDPRISLSLTFLDDEELVEIATESELVVLPYREMHNSGSALAALSMDRRVLVPDNEVNRALEQEVGDGWLIRYDGPLTADVLRLALENPRPSTSSPDLSRRDWDRVADEHVNAYLTARDR